MTEKEYLIVCLGEECSEVAQEVSKIMRFGIDDQHPDGGPSNERRLQAEVVDVLAVIEIMADRQMIDFPEDFQERIFAKKKKLAHYLEYSRERGRIEPNEK